MTATTDNAVAIVGMGCRFPGASDVESYWSLLQGGGRAIGEVPDGRWTRRNDVSDRGGFVDGIEEFDAEFFGIAEAEAATTDPQHRMLLQTAWRALEHAGIVPLSLRGSDVGVFVGSASHEFSIRLWQDCEDPHAPIGTSCGLAANRLSYFFGTLGPSVTVDSACSSSLTALHLAARAIRDGDCETALVGGVSVLLVPGITAALARAGKISADGRCRSFGRDANGFVRGEGAGVVVLKRSAAARRDGNPILALVAGSAVGHNGSSNGISAPHPGAQSRLITRAMAEARVDPTSIGYIEASATGTPLGDAIEMRAITDAIVRHRDAADGPLLVGSVKSNIGHLEAAGGIAGAIKAVLAIQHGEIPASLDSSELNALCVVDPERVSVPQTNTEWRCGRERRVAGVGSFGFGGSNSYLFLRGVAESREADVPAVAAVEFLPLSARSRPALEALLASWRSAVPVLTGRAARDVAASASSHREHFAHRTGVLFGDVADLDGALATALVDLARGEAAQRSSRRRVLIRIGASETPCIERAAALLRSAPRFRAILGTALIGLDAPRGQRYAAWIGGHDAAPVDDPAWRLLLQLGLAAFLHEVVAGGVFLVDDATGAEFVGLRLDTGLADFAARGMSLAPGPGTRSPRAASVTVSWGPGTEPSRIGLAGLPVTTLQPSLWQALYGAGVDLEWSRIHPRDSYSVVPIPGHPWLPRRHWPEGL